MVLPGDGSVVVRYFLGVCVFPFEVARFLYVGNSAVSIEDLSSSFVSSD